MANVQTITPTFGQGCIYTAQGPGLTPGYSAIDDRRAGLYGPQEGVLPTDANAGTGWECVERAAGANSQIQVNANLSCARVQGDSVTAQGLYTIAPHSAVVLLDITAAHATLPRIDQVILEVLDNVHDASGSSLARLRIVDGTPTAAATLDNRLGVAALPSNAIRLCDMLVDFHASGTVTMQNSKIRDRRQFSRGFNKRLEYGGGNLTFNQTSNALYSSTNLVLRAECSGVPLEVSLLARASMDTTGQNVYALPYVDGIAQTAYEAGYRVDAAGEEVPLVAIARFELTPAAGSHVVGVGGRVSGGTLTIQAATPKAVLRVREAVRQDVANNSTTSG